LISSLCFRKGDGELADLNAVLVFSSTTMPSITRRRTQRIQPGRESIIYLTRINGFLIQKRSSTHSSDFQATLPPSGFGWTTEMIASDVPSSTSQPADVSTSAEAAATSLSASSNSSGGSSNALGIGLGVGLGVGFVLLSIVGWLLWRRRGRSGSSQAGTIRTEPMGHRSVAGDTEYQPAQAPVINSYSPTSSSPQAYHNPSQSYGASNPSRYKLRDER